MSFGRERTTSSDRSLPGAIAACEGAVAFATKDPEAATDHFEDAARHLYPLPCADRGSTGSCWPRQTLVVLGRFPAAEREALPRSGDIRTRGCCRRYRAMPSSAGADSPTRKRREADEPANRSSAIDSFWSYGPGDRRRAPGSVRILSIAMSPIFTTGLGVPLVPRRWPRHPDWDFSRNPPWPARAIALFVTKDGPSQGTNSLFLLASVVPDPCRKERAMDALTTYKDTARSMWATGDYDRMMRQEGLYEVGNRIAGIRLGGTGRYRARHRLRDRQCRNTRSPDRGESNWSRSDSAHAGGRT